MLDHIEPEGKWSHCSRISIYPWIPWNFIERTIPHHRFMGLRVDKYSEHLIGMIISSFGFIVAPMRSYFWVFHKNYSKSLLPILQTEQSVWRFSRTVSPPFAHAFIWSTWRIVVESVAGFLPHILHLKLSRFITINRSRQFIVREVLCLELTISFFSSSEKSDKPSLHSLLI